MLMPRASSYSQPGMAPGQPQQYDAPYAPMMPQPSHHLISSLQSCVSSTASCVQTMNEAIYNLNYAIQDHPRLVTVLKSQRHFDLVSGRDIEQAREHIASEVRPHIEELCRRAAAEISREDRRVVALRNRHEALQQRLQNLRSIDKHQSKLQDAPPAPTDPAVQAQLDNLNATLAALKHKKLALLAKADALEAEANPHS
ncbi:uncharacterized protein PAN0_006c2829 [Moesziomyces antarcticus]|uniref:Related to DASH complex subunit spc19 (Outer kinetochore protein spc19) n=2 Tax=Pseudozyma antarctica TaxID=84753 RepID=A0A5C3FMJ1_PSEA2|nr:uncharacterized protein PAN0_006c2829 [Moesziomyces antarcticus]GAK64615.1 hypothetical protein PAN0_006c2829 [Moesziomyces antarcticus]SPO45592.1 related to DASH complex subunit spc19 (Outer kinetochore protein spc19) [Moesziomyces antarcticus]